MPCRIDLSDYLCNQISYQNIIISVTVNTTVGGIVILGFVKNLEIFFVRTALMPM